MFYRNLTVILVWFMMCGTSYASPTLNFSDIVSGSDTGIGDGLGSGAIVSIWGNNLGDTQGTSKIYFTDSLGAKREASYIYYWRNADGELPGAPSDLYTYHKMQEVSFSLPDSASGLGSITVEVEGTVSTSLPFTVRGGNIYHIKSSGNNSNDGSYSAPWITLNSALSGDGKISAGDIIYSHGVGSTSDVNIGNVGSVIGTEENPISVIAYPATLPVVNATSDAGFRNWNSVNKYWNFSKFYIDTVYQGFSIFQGARYIGNEITGATVNSGYSGVIGGGCAGKSPDMCGGHKIYGNEAHDYGEPGTVDQLNHLFYISNRSGSPAVGYKIGWNYLHDNPIYQGIHVYDQESCGGWSGSIDIHDNVVKNQAENAININFTCVGGNPTTFNIYNNLTILDDNYNLSGNSAPGAALRIEASTDTVVNVVNNTFIGWAEPNTFGTALITLKNNIFKGSRDVAFVSGAPDVSSGNIFYSTATTTSPPTWAPYTVNPLLDDSFIPSLGSVAINNADSTILSYVATDIIGSARLVGVIDIGAFEYGTTTPTTPTTSTIIGIFKHGGMLTQSKEN